MRPGSASDGVDYMTPEEAAKVILSGVARGATSSPWDGSRGCRGGSCAPPRLYARLMRRSISGEG